MSSSGVLPVSVLLVSRALTQQMASSGWSLRKCARRSWTLVGQYLRRSAQSARNVDRRGFVSCRLRPPDSRGAPTLLTEPVLGGGRGGGCSFIQTYQSRARFSKCHPQALLTVTVIKGAQPQRMMSMFIKPSHPLSKREGHMASYGLIERIQISPNSVASLARMSHWGFQGSRYIRTRAGLCRVGYRSGKPREF